MSQREDVPDADTLSRLVLAPAMANEARELLWASGAVFQFPDGKGESLVWGKYADLPRVHVLGCELAKKKRERKPECAYVGCIQATAGRIRGFRNQNGHGFKVVHEPDEGIHHTEVSYSIAPDKQLTKTDKTELKVALRGMFSSLVKHTCDVAA